MTDWIRDPGEIEGCIQRLRDDQRAKVQAIEDAEKCIHDDAAEIDRLLDDLANNVIPAQRNQGR